MLALEHLLQPLGLELVPIKKTVKLIRHVDQRVDVAKLYRDDRGRFELYQAYQSGPVFSTSELLVSFLGRGECQAVW
jgi:hypothetical protein